MIIGVVALVLIGWWISQKPAEEEVISPENGAEEENNEEGGTETEMALSDLLTTMQNVPSYSYEVVVTSLDGTITSGRFWKKGGNIKFENTVDDQVMVYILQEAEEKAYLYFPAEETAMIVDWETAQTTAENMAFEETLDDLESYHPTIMGEETIDGKNCLVVQTAFEGMEIKSWLWKEYGLPLKSEMKTDEGTTTSELRNIQIGEIADSVFELPAGVEITDFGI
jgi:outer membrane lipoprotein-sorting protein